MVGRESLDLLAFPVIHRL